MERLAVIMPVYNEEEAIGTVLDKWVKALDQIGMKYTINPYNDGSKDGSLKVIEAKAEEYPGKVIAHTKPNGGHGPTILQGYREAAEAGCTWVFQIDSDDEMGPEGFAEIWNARGNYDFLVGIRDGRKQALPRKIISAVSRMSVRLFYGKSIWDVNTPYRLMRVSAFKKIWETIPQNTFAPNVIISGMAGFNKLRCYETRVPQKDRQTGEVSIKKWKLFKAAMKSFWQTIAFSIRNANFFFPVSFLLSVLFFTLMLNYNPFATKPYASTDSDVYFMVGRALHNGIIPYKDIFDHKGPLLYFINALGDILFDFRGIGMIEIMFWIMFLSIIIKIQRILKFNLQYFNIIIIILPFLLYPLLSGGNLVEEYSLPFIAYGNLWLIKLFTQDDIKKWDSLLLGVCASATFCLRQNMIIIFIVDGLALTFCFLIKQLQWEKFIKIVITGLLGAFLCLFIICIFFVYTNSFNDMLFCTWKFNLAYSTNKISILQICIKMTCRIIKSFYLLLPILAVILLYFNRNVRNNTYLYAFIVLNVILSVISCTFARSFYEHYLIIMIPVFVILIGSCEAIINLKINKKLYPFVIMCIVLFTCILIFQILEKHALKTSKVTDDLHDLIHYFNKKENYRSSTLVLGNNCFLYRELNLVPKFKYIYQVPIIRYSKQIENDFLQSIIQKEYIYIIDPIYDGTFRRSNNSDNITQEIYKALSNSYSSDYLNSRYVIYKKNTN